MTQRMPSPDLSSHTCLMCGKEWTRKAHKGQQPKWCSVTCRELGKKGAAGVCERCEKPYFGTGKRFCSTLCAGVIKSSGTSPGPAVRRAYEAGLWDEVLRLLESSSTLDSGSGCWLWGGSINRDGYPYISRRAGFLGVHRISLEAKWRAHLGSQTAHHVCANSRCVNPDHLVPATHAQNIAEMMARRSYRKRIEELEAALAAIDPDHSLLTLVPVA